jgi:hypothetical protein
MVERVLTMCETAPAEVSEPLLILLRRFATESAREEARVFCDELVAEASVESVFSEPLPDENQHEPQFHESQLDEPEFPEPEFLEPEFFEAVPFHAWHRNPLVDYQSDESELQESELQESELPDFELKEFRRREPLLSDLLAA